MASIRRYSAAEKGKAPREGPDPLPPKKRLRLPHDAGAGREVARPWQSRPPPGFPLPLYARAQDDGVYRRAAPDEDGRAAIALPAAPWTHAEDSSCEFVVWAAMPPNTWIRLPRFFASELPPRGPVELLLRHAGCRSSATGAEDEVVPPGDVFMTQGWGEIARACCVEGALAIHFEYDGAATLFFKVFNEEGERLECCPEGSSPQGAAVGAGPASVPFGASSSSSDDSWESSDSPEPSESPESSDDSYMPPSSRRSWSAAAAAALRR